MSDLTKGLKMVSVEQMETSIARALADLTGRELTVYVRDLEYKSEGAWIQLEVSPDLNLIFRSLLDGNN